jgi:bifunctional UDP-N-acetylglucosamine pyrophosphorylase/glucosamine-1-phosphate N-acetyltransferase
MKAIILAAWRGTRLQPLTNTIPKPMIQICWKPILEHLIENIYQYVNEIIIVVKYKQEKIREYFGDNYKWIPISYQEQSDEKWTAAALKWIETQDDVFILYWDSIISKNDIENIIESEKYGVFAQKVDDPSKYGIFQTQENNKIISVVEKPQDFIGDLANLWGFKMKATILNLINNIELSSRWEYELTDAINLYVNQNDFYAFELQEKFIDVWYPWDILEANNYYLKTLEKSYIYWEIEENVQIKWNIILEKWAVLKSWTYIEWNCYIWKDTKIGPNTYLRWNTVIGSWCKIWNAVEVKNSCFWNNSNAAHLSYIWDSIIGNNVNLWWWFITANLRHDNENIKVLVKWNLTNTGRRKLWAIVWDNVKTAMNTSIYPWRVIQNDSFTQPWEIIIK